MMQASLCEFQAQSILPVKPSPDGIGSTAVREVLDTL
jgi:hypothetical protein